MTCYRESHNSIWVDAEFVTGSGESLRFALNPTGRDGRETEINRIVEGICFCRNLSGTREPRLGLRVRIAGPRRSVSNSRRQHELRVARGSLMCRISTGISYIEAINE